MQILYFSYENIAYVALPVAWPSDEDIYSFAYEMSNVIFYKATLSLRRKALNHGNEKPWRLLFYDYMTHSPRWSSVEIWSIAWLTDATLIEEFLMEYHSLPTCYIWQRKLWFRPCKDSFAAWCQCACDQKSTRLIFIVASTLLLR